MVLALALVASLTVLVAGGCGDDNDSGTKASTAQKTVPQPHIGPKGQPCKVVKSALLRPEQHLKRPKTKLDPAKTYRVTVETNCGTFVIKLDPKRAPKTSASFASLVRKGFYSGLGFHRIAPDYVIQAGDPNGNGSGGPGYTIRERPPRTSSTRGAWSPWPRAAISLPAPREASSSS